MNLIYMAKPIYGGWVTFTSHLCLKYNCELFKIGKRTEKQNRKYGYGVDYRNLKIDEILSLKNKVITAVDKNYWEHLHLFPKGTMLIIHDPTELKCKNNPLKDLLNHFKIITIRKTVQDFLKKEYNVDSDFIIHPFYEYPKSDEKSEYYSTAISRIDFDKHIELILLAVNINLVSFSIFINDLSGQIFTLFILTVAAAEAAIGLAIIVVYYRNSGTVRVEEIHSLKG